MTVPRFHLGWFTNFTPDDWKGPWASADGTDFTGDFFVDLARSLERACFDFVMLEDKSLVADTYGGSMEAALKWPTFGPKHDPVPLATLLAAHTSRLGVVATMSTSFYPPFLLARLSATIDHISRGRFGWNVVTSAEGRAAQNFGFDALPEHDQRYEIADEYVELVDQLWRSWDADAVVKDRATGVFADHTRVRPVDFVGKYFKSRGPLNTLPPPQGRPVLVQAGASPRGREFASKNADSIIAEGPGAEGMKRYRDDVRTRMASAGRDPDDCKLLFVVHPIIGGTESEAAAEVDRIVSDPGFIEAMLVGVSSNSEIDLSQFDIDKPLPELTTNGERGMLDAFRLGQGDDDQLTLRKMAEARLHRSVRLVGTPEQVADRMCELMGEIGGDGFLINRTGAVGLSRRYIAEITDGLVPELQRRGVVRTSYSHERLRDNLLDF